MSINHRSCNQNIILMNSLQLGIYEIKRVLAEESLRKIPDRIDKAVWFVRNYAGDVSISTNAVCMHFKTNHGVLERRTWSQLLGHTGCTESKNRYLAPVYEELLASKLDVMNKKWNSQTRDELKNSVSQFNF